MIHNWRVYDAVMAHGPSRVYPANSGSCSDRTVPARRTPAVERSDLLDDLSGIFRANLTVTRPHVRKTTVRETVAFRCVTQSYRSSFSIYNCAFSVAGVGFEPT